MNALALLAIPPLLTAVLHTLSHIGLFVWGVANKYPLLCLLGVSLDLLAGSAAAYKSKDFELKFLAAKTGEKLFVYNIAIITGHLFDMLFGWPDSARNAIYAYLITMDGISIARNLKRLGYIKLAGLIGNLSESLLSVAEQSIKKLGSEAKLETREEDPKDEESK